METQNKNLINIVQNFQNYFQEEDDEEEEDIPLDLEEIEAVSKKARQDEEIHSEHMQV